MTDRYFNPFQGIDVSVPTEFHADVIRYSQKEGKAVIDNSPFPRMVDMWFFAMCVAARRGLPPADLGGRDTRKIIEGSIFGGDPWRVHAIMLIAVAHAGSIDIVSEPRRMMATANGLAVSGFPLVIEMMRDGEGDPIWNLSDAVEKLVAEDVKT